MLERKTKDMKKIIMIDPQSYEGLASYDHNLCSHITNTEIILIGNEKYDYLNMKKNYSFCPTFKYKKYKQPLKTISYLHSFRKAIKSILRINPDLVHIQWLKLPKIDSIFLKKLKSKKIPIVYTVHNVLPHNNSNKYVKSYKYVYNEIVDTLIVHTENSRKILVDEFEVDQKKIFVIPHGLHELRINKQIYEKKKKEYEMKIKQNRIVFSFIGNISYYKGIDLIIETWENSVKLRNNHEILLLIAGKNNYNDDVMKLNKYANVYLDLRKLSNEEFEAYLEISDVVLLPYRRISQSGVLLSAINRSKPFIVTKVGGLIDPFKEFDNCGWIMQNITSNSLEEEILAAIRSLKCDSKEYTENSLWNRLKRTYSWEEIGKDTKKAYELTRNQKG